MQWSGVRASPVPAMDQIALERDGLTVLTTFKGEKK